MIANGISENGKHRLLGSIARMGILYGLTCLPVFRGISVFGADLRGLVGGVVVVCLVVWVANPDCFEQET